MRALNEGSCEVEVFPACRPIADAHPTYDGGTLKQLAEFNLLAPDDEARPRILEPLDPKMHCIPCEFGSPS